MASRLRKIFSRKKDNPQRPDGESHATPDNPNFRTSLYNSAPTATPPETGSYPIKGDRNSPALAVRRGSSRSRKHQSTAIDEMPPPIPPRQQHAVPPPIPPRQQHAPRPASMNPSAPAGGLRMVQDDPTLSDDLSNLNIHDRYDSSRGPNQPQAPTRAPPSAMEARYGEDTRNRTSEGITAADLRDPQYSYMSAVYGQKAPTQNVVDGNDPNRPSRRYPSDEYIAKRDRALSQGREQRSSSNSDAYRVTRPTDPSAVNDISPERPGYDGLTPVRRRSIPRKQVGSGLSTPVSPPLPSSRTSPNPSPMHARQSSAHDKPLPSTPVSTTGAGLGLGYGGDRSAQPSFDEGRMLVQGAKEKPSLDGILDLSNTRDTVVIEKFAPAVVHETVHQKVHEVREEVITREVHTHDVFHRIQPVIDVEVLPARHFLPAEGGGLVEISADEVPGRRNNWVIAETASKIPSDEPALPKITRFSAREFPGNEGDAKRYITPKGIERTEETWVHPPELETGGMLTGQTWPMHFSASEEASLPSEVRSTGNQHGLVAPQTAAPEMRPVNSPRDMGNQVLPLSTERGASNMRSTNPSQNMGNPGQPMNFQSNMRSPNMYQSTGYQGQQMSSRGEMRTTTLPQTTGNQGVSSQSNMRPMSTSPSMGTQGQPMTSFDEQRRDGGLGNTRYSAV
ncbi:hypothetical protein MMC16_006427 [Acarospora aff. strigata]|nr:hypothetical protein [Acarospora aff. strigata]